MKKKDSFPLLVFTASVPRMSLAVYFLFGYFVCHCNGTKWRPRLVYSSPNRMVNEKDNITLLCKFDASPPARVIWFKDGIMLAYDQRIYSRATSIQNLKSTYHLYVCNARITDTGLYNCTGVNSQGRCNGTIYIRVHRQSKPVFHSPLRNITLYVGQLHEVRCEAFADSKDDLKYAWSKKNGFIDDYKVSDLGDSRLVFSEARLSDTGQYLCTASNNAGKSTSSLFVKVVADPSWVLMPPRSVTAETGAKVSINCTFVGNSINLKVNWFGKVNRKILHKTSWRKVNEHYRVKLEFEKLSVKDSGKYIVNVSNSEGSITATMYIMVFAIPKAVITEKKALTVLEGEIVHLNCKVKGSPPLTVAWQNANKSVLSRTLTNLSLPGRTVLTTLSLRYTFEARKGLRELSCRGKNNIGEDTDTIKLNVTEKDDVSPHTRRTDDTWDDNPANIAFIILAVAVALVILVLISLGYFMHSRRKSDANIPQHTFSSVRYGRDDNDFETAEVLVNYGKTKEQFPDFKSLNVHIYSTPDVPVLTRGTYSQ